MDLSGRARADCQVLGLGAFFCNFFGRSAKNRLAVWNYCNIFAVGKKSVVSVDRQHTQQHKEPLASIEYPTTKKENITTVFEAARQQATALRGSCQ